MITMISELYDSQSLIFWHDHVWLSYAFVHAPAAISDSGN